MHAGTEKVLSVWHIDRCRHYKLFKDDVSKKKGDKREGRGEEERERREKGRGGEERERREKGRSDERWGGMKPTV